MKIQEVMTKGAVSCTVENTAREALTLMWKHDVGALPVMDGERVVGMITDRDLAMAASMRNARPSELSVGDVTTRQLWSVGPADPVDRAEKIMEERQVRRVPVVTGGRLEGMVTLADLARARSTMPAEKVVQTLAAITEPRVPAAAG